MFNDIVIVQSAVSAFNNAALVMPAFFWWAILALPLMYVVWKCAPMIQGVLHLDNKNISARGGALVAALTFLWVVLFGGNYSVLRDGVSVLPFVTAVIVFLTSLFVASHLREMPDVKMGLRTKTAVTVLILFALALSDMHAWWGPVLQMGAFLLGWLMGRVALGTMRPVAGIVLIVLVTTTAMLMQPEFFRFGQLGNLTLIHLLFLLATGVSAAAVIVLNNVKPSGRIHKSAFVKLKWAARVIALLAVALFVLTESVPLFFGACGAFFVLFALSVLHAQSIPVGLVGRLLAIMIFLFGTITTMPVISAIGVLYYTMLPQGDFWREFRVLL